MGIKIVGQSMEHYIPFNRAVEIFDKAFGFIDNRPDRIDKLIIGLNGILIFVCIILEGILGRNNGGYRRGILRNYGIGY
jgi:hypothetical protein